MTLVALVGLALASLVRAQTPPQPQFPTCATFYEVMSSESAQVNHTDVVVVTVDQGSTRTDAYVAATSSSPAQMQTLIMVGNQTASIVDYLNGTVLCDLYMLTYTMASLPPLAFQGVALCGIGQLCNVWLGSVPGSVGATMTVKTLQSYNNVFIGFDYLYANGAALHIALTHFALCSHADKSLFVVPPTLKCTVVPAAPLKTHLKSLFN